MSWTPLSEGRYSVPLRDHFSDRTQAIPQELARLPSVARLEQLPLILAGPILRHTESNSVTVWVALKAPREVTLKVYATDANGSTIKTLVLEGVRSTVPLGKQLHIVAVTAKPPITEQGRGRLRFYSCDFQSPGLKLTPMSIAAINVSPIPKT